MHVLAERRLLDPYLTLPNELSTAPAGGFKPANRQPCATGPPGKIS